MTWAEIEAEAERAASRYGPFTSTHEALGVLTEEMAELIEAIRANNIGAVANEAAQVSAVAGRLALLAADPPPSFFHRSVK